MKIETKDFPCLSYYKSGHGPALVLLHGFPADHTLWRKINPDLFEKFTVICPDLPGSGESTFSSETLGMELMAESVVNILDHEGIEKVVILGHSMGGYAALAFAEIYPQRTYGLSLLHSTASADTDEKKEARLKSINIIRNGGKDTFIRQMVPNLFASHFKQSHPEIIEEQVTDGIKNSADSLIAMYYAMINRPDRTEVLKKATFPVQFLIGREDNILAFDKSLQQSYLANINFVSVYNDCGHMSMLECPELLSSHIIDFARYCYSLNTEIQNAV